MDGTRYPASSASSDGSTARTSVRAHGGNPSKISVLSPWARTLILAVLPSLLALLAGYRVPSNRV